MYDISRSELHGAKRAAAMASPLAASDARGNLDIVGAETVVEWTMPTGQTCFLSSKDTIPSGAAHIAFDLLFRPATTAASIRLRAPIMLKGLGRKMTPLFLFIPPERIESMTVVGQEETQAPEAVRKGLGSSGAVSLRFKLTQPGDLVVPPLDAVIPKKKVYWALFDSLKSLALALDLVVYLNPTTISSEEDVRSVGDALSGGKFATSIPHTDISRFYDGKGGKVLMPSELNKSIPAPGHEPEPVDSPPSYADLGPGPPAPPIKEGTFIPQPLCLDFGIDIRRSMLMHISAEQGPSKSPDPPVLAIAAESAGDGAAVAVVIVVVAVARASPPWTRPKWKRYAAN